MSTLKRDFCFDKLVHILMIAITNILLFWRDFTSFRKRVSAPFGAASTAVGKHVTSLQVFLSPLLSSSVAQAGHSLVILLSSERWDYWCVITTSF